MRLKVLLCFLLTIHVINASPVLTEKRIYLLDVTRSMAGLGSIKTPDIFEIVKNNLIASINNIEDTNTEIVIIPFTNIVHEGIRFTISQKDSMIYQISEISLRNGDTNIAGAWNAGVHELDSTKVNYMFLLTDGLHNTGVSKEELLGTLRMWEEVAKNKYFFSFYVMLTPNAKELEISNVVEETRQMYLIESLDIDASLIRTALNQQANIYEDKMIGCSFVSNNSKVFVEDLELSFQIEDNPYYSIGATYVDSISSNFYYFEVIEKKEKIDIPIDTVVTLSLYHNRDQYPFVFFTPETISFRIINRGVRRMTIKQSNARYEK